MKIRKLRLKNIGVFDDETIEFKPCRAKDKAEIHIFTGQNGSGKSTTLMALATVFDNLEEINSTEFKHLEYSKNYFYKRFRYFDYLNNTHLSEGLICFDDGDNVKIFGCPTCQSIHIGSAFTHNLSKSVHLKLHAYRRIITHENTSAKLEFAAFAYSGNRYIESTDIQAIKEFKEYPLSKALNFVKNYGDFNINQWIANNLSRRALEKEKGNQVRANRFAENIELLEKAIEMIIGEKIEFELETETISIVVKTNNVKLDFDVLPDGLKSLISWMGDLLMRIDSLKWQDDFPIFEKNLFLFLDEIEVHLHPAWQRKVLPVVQKLFKNSQIFISTHSPFVVNSVDDAWVYKLELENGKARVAETMESEDGLSYQTVLSDVFGIDKEFGGEAQKDLDEFYKIVKNGKNLNEKEEKRLLKLAKSLALQSEELNSIVQIELRQLSRRKGKEFSL